MYVVGIVYRGFGSKGVLSPLISICILKIHKFTEEFLRQQINLKIHSICVEFSIDNIQDIHYPLVCTLYLN